MCSPSRGACSACDWSLRAAGRRARASSYHPVAGAPLDSYVALVSSVVEATAGSGADPRLIARSLALRGLLLLRAGRIRDGSQDLVRALGLADTLGDDGVRATALHALGRALLLRSDHDAARAHFERARLFEAAGKDSDSASVLASLAAVSAARGQRQQALPLLERARAAHRRSGDRLAEVEDLRALIALLLDLGELATAERQIEESDALCRLIDDRAGLALVLLLRGLLHQLRDDGAAARAAHLAAASELARLGRRGDEAAATGFLGLLCRREGKLAEAHALLSQALHTPDTSLSALFALHRGRRYRCRRADEALHG
jgi:tetratricopeptide (TPR) repeat protein